MIMLCVASSLDSSNDHTITFIDMQLSYRSKLQNENNM